MDGTFRFRLADGEKMMSTALLLGLIWSGLWMAYLYVIMKCFPWEMLHDYPEDVRKASTLPEPTRKLMALLFAGVDYAILRFVIWE